MAPATRHVRAHGGHQGGGQVPGQAVRGLQGAHPQERQLQQHRHAAALRQDGPVAGQVDGQEGRAAEEGEQDGQPQRPVAGTEGEGPHHHRHGGDVEAAQDQLRGPGPGEAPRRRREEQGPQAAPRRPFLGKGFHASVLADRPAALG